MIVLLHAPDPAFVKEASKRGVFAYITDGEAHGLAELDRHRPAPLRGVSGPRGRVRAPRDHRAREGNPDGAPLGGRAAAFEMLREHSRSTNRKLVDIASAVVDGHALLPKEPTRRPRSAGRLIAAPGAVLSNGGGKVDMPP